MSVDRAKQLIERMSADEDFRNKVANAEGDAKKALLEEYGFGDVTPQEVQFAAVEWGAELSEAELEAVAGGRLVEWVSAGAAVAGAAATAAGAAAA